jgi:hypothetical protein
LQRKVFEECAVLELGNAAGFDCKSFLEVDSRRKLLEMYDRRGFESCICSRKGCMQNKEYR